MTHRAVIINKSFNFNKLGNIDTLLEIYKIVGCIDAKSRDFQMYEFYTMKLL